MAVEVQKYTSEDSSCSDLPGLNLSMTRAAFQLYFSSPILIICALPLVAEVQNIVSTGADILALSKCAKTDTGFLCTLGELDDLKAPVFQEDSLIGHAFWQDKVPVGVIAVVEDDDTVIFTKLFTQSYDAAGAFDLPEVFNGEQDASLLAVLFAQMMVKRYGNSLVALGRRDDQIAYLRRKTETLSYSVEKTRQMLDAVGIDRLLLVAELEAGSGIIGPSGQIETSYITQELPLDCKGLAAIDLYCASFSPKWSGLLVVSVVRIADHLLLDRHSLGADDLFGDVIRLPLALKDDGEGGQAALTIEWIGPVEHSPLFKLSEANSRRFGQNTLEGVLSKPLAMSIYRTIEAFKSTRPSGNHRSDYVEALSWRDVSCGGLPWRFIRGEIEYQNLYSELGDDPILVGNPNDPDYPGDFFQCHPLFGHPSGVILSDLFKAGDTCVSIKVLTDHPSGPPVRYFLALMSNTNSTGALDLTSLKEGAFIAKTDRFLSAGITAELSLELPDPLESDADIILWVETSDKEISYAWCRFSGISLGRPLPERKYQGVVKGLELEGRALNRVYLTHIKYTDLVSRLEFISGHDVLSQVTSANGFRPLLLDDVGHYMQTHPLENALSGAFVSDIIPSSACRVTSRVKTAHASAGDMLYVMACLDSDCHDLEKRAPLLVKYLTENLSDWNNHEADLLSQGGKLIKGEFGKAQVAAIRVKAMQQNRLSLDVQHFQEPLHMVWTVLPLEGSAAFGWCRWQNLQIETKATHD